MKKITALLLSSLLIYAPGLQAEEKPKKPWNAGAELSYVTTNGNTKTSTLSTKAMYDHSWKKTKLELEAGGLGSETDRETTAEQYYASEKFDYSISAKTYAFEKFRWEKNRFAGIDGRYDSQLGLGNEIFKNTKHKIIGEAGGGYIYEDRVNSQTNDFISARGYGKYTYTLSETAKFTQDGEYISNLEDSDDYRIKTVTSLTARLNGHLLSKTSYEWERLNKPPVGFSKSDTMFSMALVFEY